MAKQLLFITLMLLVSACKPVSEQVKAIALIVPFQCIDSQSECEISTELANFSVKFSQPGLAGEIKTELPFYIELAELADSTKSQQSEKQSITRVSAFLEGKDMFMGKVPVFFKMTDDGNAFSAQSLLASCSEDKMVWRLWVTVEIADKKQTFFIDFTSQRL